MRDAYVMYRSFWEAIKDLPDKEIAEIMKAISEYALNDVEPNVDGVIATIFKLVRPQIDANNRKYENGCKGAKYGVLGGRPTKEKTDVGKKKSNDKISKDEVNNFFESIWALYPVKKGKGSISDSKKKELYKIGFEAIKNCIDRYCRDMEGKDKQFWKYGSTFFNTGYVDYLDNNYDTADNVKTIQNEYSENHTEDDDSENMDFWNKDEVNEDV